MTTLEVLHDPASLAALKPEWQSLWERCPHTTPFQSPEWLLPWQRHLGGGRLYVLAVRREGTLVALLLLRECGWPRRLAFLGAGVSDYLDVLLAPEGDCESMALLRAGLAEAMRQGAALDFDQLRPNSPLLGWELPSKRHQWQREPCPLLPLPPTVEELRKQWSPSLRKHVAYARRRLEREGGSIELVDCTTNGEWSGLTPRPPSLRGKGETTGTMRATVRRSRPSPRRRGDGGEAPTLDETLTALFAAHQQRWNRRLLPGAFARKTVRTFHREAAAGFLAAGILRLYAMRIDEEVVAALYCFASHGRCDYYAAGFQEQVRALSPGTLLIAHALEDAVTRGDTAFDFLRGNEPYKYRWGAEDQFNQRILCTPATLPGRWTAHIVAAELAVEAKVKQLTARWVQRGS